MHRMQSQALNFLLLLTWGAQVNVIATTVHVNNTLIHDFISTVECLQIILWAACGR